jgi:galactokinase
MDLLEIITKISEDWIYLSAAFMVGAAWWQGKLWFHKVNVTLDQIVTEHTTHHKSHSQALEKLASSLEQIDNRMKTIEQNVLSIHEEVHQQEVKIAVLENTRSKRRIKSL